MIAGLFFGKVVDNAKGVLIAWATAKITVV